MLHYFKFRQDLFDPVPATDIYGKLDKGRGRPQECPPIRAANAFGFDVLANFDMTFIRNRDGSWRCEEELVVASDFDYAPPHSAEEAAGTPLSQNYAWFWEKGQKIPHVITDNVYETIKNQVKVSTFLYLKTDPNELLLFAPIPLPAKRPWTTMTALVDTDWYPASYPWHAVLLLDPGEKRITLHRGEPICRLIPLRRDTYFAKQMTPDQFDAFFEQGQQWLSTHGKPIPPEAQDHDPHSSSDSAHPPGTLDITKTYVRQQIKSHFVVLK